MTTVKNLLKQIANAIRLKTGITKTMTLEEMASAINSITVSGELGYTFGSFVSSSTGNAVSIEHGLNQVPAALIFIKNGSAASSLTGTQTSRSDALLSIVFGENDQQIYCSANIRKGSTGSGTTATTTTRSWIKTNISDSSFGTDKSVMSYYMSSINEVSFTTPRYLDSGSEYIWIAFRKPLI